jgi:hypothetical protein
MLKPSRLENPEFQYPLHSLVFWGKRETGNFRSFQNHEMGRSESILFEGTRDGNHGWCHFSYLSKKKTISARFLKLRLCTAPLLLMFGNT